MKRLRHLALGGMLATAALACTSDAPAPPATAAAESRPVEAPRPVVRATLADLRGEVTVKRAADDAWQAAAEAMPLFDNDKVRTSRGASAHIRFATGSVLTMGEDALVGIAEERPTPSAQGADVTVLRGRIDATLPDPRSQSLTVTTPSATVRAGREIVFQ